MAMYNYGIGGNEVKVDASEAIADISNNKTMLIQKLTVEEPFTPEAVYGLKTVEEVFAHFKPSCKVEFETKEGATKEEEFRFSNVGDFGVKKVVENSPYLSELTTEVDQYTKIAKQLKSNKVLQNLLANPETNKAVIDTLTALLAELNAQD
jgi:predicted component of type VI protein secretion system